MKKTSKLKELIRRKAGKILHENYNISIDHKAKKILGDNNKEGIYFSNIRKYSPCENTLGSMKELLGLLKVVQIKTVNELTINGFNEEVFAEMPKQIRNNLTFRNCKIPKMKNTPKKVGQTIRFTDCIITSLEGLPNTCKSIEFRDCQLLFGLNALPKNVDGIDIHLSNTNTNLKQLQWLADRPQAYNIFINTDYYFKKNHAAEQGMETGKVKIGNSHIYIS